MCGKGVYAKIMVNVKVQKFCSGIESDSFSYGYVIQLALFVFI